jgi:hypothetical protein
MHGIYNKKFVVGIKVMIRFHHKSLNFCEELCYIAYW